MTNSEVHNYEPEPREPEHISGPACWCCPEEADFCGCRHAVKKILHGSVVETWDADPECDICGGIGYVPHDPNGPGRVIYFHRS